MNLKKNCKIQKKTLTIFGININIILLGISSFLNDISSEMILPILPLFIKSLGGTGIIIGIIGGFKTGLSNILKVFSGYASDKTGKRKVFVVSGYFLSSVFKVFLALSQTWHQLIIFSGLERVGKGLRDAPRDSMISTYAKEKRGKSFGFHRALDTSGAIIGSIIVLILFWFLKFDFKPIILISAAISFLSLIPLQFVKEKSEETFNVKETLKIKKIKSEMNFKTNFFNLSSKVKTFIIISSIYSLSNFSYMFFILKAQTLFSGKMTFGIPIFLYVLFNTFYAILAIPFGVLSDKIGRKKIIFAGYLLFSIVCLGFLLFESLPALIILFILYGTTYAMIEGNQRAYISDMSPKEKRGTAIGLFHTINGIFSLISSIIAGIIWQYIGENETFLYGSIVSFVSIILVIVFWKKLNGKELKH